MNSMGFTNIYEQIYSVIKKHGDGDGDGGRSKICLLENL